MDIFNLFKPNVPNVERMKAQNNVKGLVKALKYEGDDSWEVQREARGALCEIKGPRAVKLLIKLLRHKDVVPRMRAAEALCEIKEAVEPFIKVLRHKRAYIREAAAWVLDPFDLRAVEPFEALRVRDANFREGAAQALGQIKDPKAVDPLITALMEWDTYAYVRQKVAWALGQIKDPRAVEPLVEALKDESYYVGKQAMEALREIGRSALEPLINALKDKDVLVRVKEGAQRAAWLLGKIRDPRAVEPLIKVLGDRDEILQEAAAWALGEIRDPRAVEPLIQAMKDENAYRKSHAAEALAKTGESAVEPLIKVLRDRGADVREAAARALGEIRDPRAVEPLIQTMKDENEWVVSRAADALAKIGESAVEPLIKVLRDRGEYVRKKAARALGEIGDAQAVPALTDIANDSSEKVRQAVREALRKLGSKPPASAFPGTKAFYNEEWNFSIAYPTDWEIIYENEPAGSWTIPIAVAGAIKDGGRPCFLVNARRGEVLQGSNNLKVTSIGQDGSLIEMPSTPQEYIEKNKEALQRSFSGFQFISAEKIRLANKPAVRLVYSYDGEMERIKEESITLFGVGVTFQLICEVPFFQYAEFQTRFQGILESFRIET